MHQYVDGQWQLEVFTDLASCLEKIPQAGMHWLNIEGRPGRDNLDRLGRFYHLEEKSLNEADEGSAGHHRPRVEFYDNYYFIVLYIILDHCKIDAYQVNIFLGQNFLITVEEKGGHTFDMLRQRLRYNGTKIANMGVDYMACSICDILIDGFYPHIQAIFEEMADLEDRISMHTEKNVAETIHDIQRRLLHLDRLAWSIQGATDALQNPDNELINPGNIQFYRNCYEHTLQISHSIENYRDVARGILDYHLSLNANQMNQVMKVLTIIATVFIPLTFIVGVYGMNFNPDAGPFSMPELNQPYGYLIIWGVMLSCAGGMLAYFRKQKWL